MDHKKKFKPPLFPEIIIEKNEKRTHEATEGNIKSVE